ncbi:MAG TPA: alpha/beta hydrolase, partial [Dehalococcoidia bacterium]
MQSHMVRGGGGVQLHVAETGVATGRPILFIHGFSQSHLTWRLQMASDLGESYRLLAMDLRGHGLSEQPASGYADPRLWAADVAGVIAQLHLEKPVLVGWSYGGFIIGDYLEEFGEGS